ncbi:MAG: diacylglycerol kinase family protein [Nibricoccus sp.]
MRKLFNSFRFAFAGFAYLLRTQRNARIHSLAALFVVGAGLYFNVARTDWAWLIAAIAWVFAAEALNTAIEILADRVTTELDEKIRHAKDVSAAAVLISAVGAVGVGVAILGPYCLRLLAQ